MHYFSRCLFHTRKSFRAGNVILISASTNNVNLFSLAGSPVSPGNFSFVINAGVTIGSTSSGTASLITGSFPVGSTVSLTNKGNIYGKEGSASGSVGGDAISLGFNISIDNTNGNIFGAGGTGGYGGGSYGGNGGAGQGSGNLAGPSSGGAGQYYSYTVTHEYWETDPETGTPVHIPALDWTETVSGYGPNGGNGGAWGAAGQTIDGGYPGGAAGYAVRLNSKTITWLGGNNGTQVKGRVA